MATLDEERGSFTQCRPLTEINSGGWDIPGSLSADGTELWFESRRQRAGKEFDVFVASWSPELEAFTNPRRVELGAEVASRPRISRSGYELFFLRGPAGPRSEVTYDIWVAWRRSLDEPFDEHRSRPLDEINSPFNEWSPVLASDGRTLLWTGWRSNSHDGGGRFAASSVWTATRPEPFDPARHSEPPRFGHFRKLRANPPETQFYDIAISDDWPADGAKVYFVSCLPSDCFRSLFTQDVYSATWRAVTPPARFRRGDSNADGTLNLTDGVFTLGYLFGGLGADPLTCLDAADTDDNGELNVADAIRTFNYLFRGGVPPSPPGDQQCGEDPTEDGLDCDSFAECP